MKENVIINSERSTNTKSLTFLLSLLACIFLIVSVIDLLMFYVFYPADPISEFFAVDIGVCFVISILATAVVGTLIHFWLRSYEMTVTNKRIYGRVAWGRRVDLPIDSVSATSTFSLLKGVSISTSSGRIRFLLIKNADDIYQVVNNLLIERQEKTIDFRIDHSKSQIDDTYQIKRFKELLDSGIITQEEFNEKKKQIMGL